MFRGEYHLCFVSAALGNAYIVLNGDHNYLPKVEDARHVEIKPLHLVTLRKVNDARGVAARSCDGGVCG